MNMKLVVAAVAAAVCASSAFAMLDNEEALAAARATLAKMTLEEKNLLVAGSGTMTIAAIPRVGITNEWWMSDNSSTVRPRLSRWSWAYEEPKAANTKLPALTALAQTWDVEWARKHGELLGSECRARGVDEILGPGVNIMRTPLCGRNWEYMGEDPFLAAKLVVPYIKGVQSYDVAATVKHFCLNNQELARKSVDTHCDLRTLNEIYLPAFRAAVKEAGVLCVMSSYNKIDGLWASENKYTQTGILRDRWGFRGMLESDWGGQHSCDFSANNGTGVEMHRGDGIVHLRNTKKKKLHLADAVKAGKVPVATLDDMALRTLYVMAKTGFLTGAPRRAGEKNTPSHQRIAREEGADSIVLLKNEKGVLPLDAKELKKVLVIGKAADVKQCGKGSSAEGYVPYEVTFFEALRNRLPGAEVSLMPFHAKMTLAKTDTTDAVDAGAHDEEQKTEVESSEAAALRKAAEASDVVFLFTGTELGKQENMESEGRDRVEFNLPKELQAAMHDVLGWKLKKCVVVSRSGSPVGYTWTDKAATLVQTSYLGMEEGNSICDVLFGDVNPSGRFCQSWPKCFSDTAVAKSGTYNDKNVTYNERFYVGYRWHDVKGIEPLFPFGYGLSYTTFEVSGCNVTGFAAAPDRKGFVAKCTVKNTGKVAGRDVVQLYVAYPGSKVERCAQELKGFAKTRLLQPGESETVEIVGTLRDLAYFDEFTSRFTTDEGDYEFRFAASSRDILGKVTVKLPGQTFAD